MSLKIDAKQISIHLIHVACPFWQIYHLHRYKYPSVLMVSVKQETSTEFDCRTNLEKVPTTHYHSPSQYLSNCLLRSLAKKKTIKINKNQIVSNLIQRSIWPHMAWAFVTPMKGHIYVAIKPVRE